VPQTDNTTIFKTLIIIWYTPPEIRTRMREYVRYCNNLKLLRLILFFEVRPGLPDFTKIKLYSFLGIDGEGPETLIMIRNIDF
jgi:hypothetical protein